MAYIMFRAARGEASHFNQSSILAQVAYSVMGAGAVTITMATAAGIKLLRSKPRNLWTEAAGAGPCLGCRAWHACWHLCVAADRALRRRPDRRQRHGFFPLESTTGGDLRVAHFVGLHACQLVPLAALSGRRSIVWGSAAAITLATLFTFAQAVMGIPLFRQ
ncbi:MAG: hypothetical protein U1E15_09255 [Hyphomicrobiales bacterium]